MQFVSIRCSNNLKESIKSELILERSERKIENSQVPEMLSAKKYQSKIFFSKNQLVKIDELFKFLIKFKLLLKIYSHSIDLALLENRTGEINSRTYLTSISDFVGNC